VRRLLIVGVAAVALGGCGTLSAAFRTDPPLLTVSEPLAVPVAVVPEPTPTEPAEPVVAVADAKTAEDIPEIDATLSLTNDVGEGGDQILLAQTQRSPQEKVDTQSLNEPEDEFDPWERFNEKMFEFNRNLDRFALKPVAQVYNVIMPEPFQVLIANGFDNISFVPRAVNSLLQGKWGGVGREVSRFLINSTAGIGGLFDAAKYWGIEKSREDFGQTLGVWGVGPGPYLILPFMEPLTVRDGIGKAVDGAMDPLSYVLPFLWVRLGMKIGETVNDRALNLELFQGFEESVIDMYSAVRHGYLRRREQLIKE
jgi:phospholipid-binding lipoprotein MlaA